MPEKPQVDVTETLDISIKNKKLTLEEKANRALSMLAEGYGKTQICKQLNMDIRTLDKLMGMSEEERNRYVKSSMELSHEHRVLKKQELISTVRTMHEKKYSIRSISKELQLSRQTVTRYLEEGATAIHGSYSVKRKSILDPYLGEIDLLMDKGIASPVIEAEIRQKGYAGSSSTLRHYMARIKKPIQDTYISNNRVPGNTELVERKTLMKLLFKKLEKIKGLDNKCLDRVNSQYPRYKELIDLVNEFKKTLTDKNVSKINQWIHKASGLNIREITSFINGITRDITAVKMPLNMNIIMDWLKAKVIKRIMYGRNSFEMLRSKLLWLEGSRTFN